MGADFANVVAVNSAGRRFTDLIHLHRLTDETAQPSAPAVVGFPAAFDFDILPALRAWGGAAPNDLTT